MDIATWIIAAASILNVAVLVVYAYFTWGIWKETRDGGRRTEELLKQSRDALRVQLLTLVRESEAEFNRLAIELHQNPQALRAAKAALRQRFARGFPGLWPEIEPMLVQPPQGEGQ